VSARLLVPVDPDFPILGGETLKVRAGLELAYRLGKPVVVLKGISVMGVPLPNAWMQSGERGWKVGPPGGSP
jgi:hypothetical protein